MAGTLSEKVQLFHSSTGFTTAASITGGTQILNLQSVPALGAVPEKIDVTCLDDHSHKYINGLIDYGDLQFGCLYDTTEYTTNSALTGVHYWGVKFPGGEGFAFSGIPTCAVDAVTVNAPLTYTLSIALQSDIEYLH